MNEANSLLHDITEDMVEFPIQDRYCITGEIRKYYMAPLTEAIAKEIGDNDDPYHQFDIGGKLIHKSDVYAMLKFAKDTKDIPVKILADLKRLFDEKNFNTMPGKYNFDTRKGSLKLTVCRDFMVHYRYGLSIIGNPDHAIILKY